MKNQYFGDINDYEKYGLIRQLTGFGEVPTTVCWMLTPNDPGHDGHRLNYLLEPDVWRRFDPVVFDHLHQQVIEHKHRDVSSVENSGILHNCRFYSEIVQDDASQRITYLLKLLEFARNSDLVFFDPDIGMEVKSIPSGRKHSSGYLYFKEVEKTFSAGHSLLIYQHWPRKPRQPFIASLANRFRTATGVKRLYAYGRKFVVFFLVPQTHHEEIFARHNEGLAQEWKEQLEIQVL